MILYLVNTEFLRVDLASLHLLLQPPLGFFFFLFNDKFYYVECIMLFITDST